MGYPTDHRAKKRKIEDEGGDGGASTFKPCARFQPTGGREYTVSIAMPGSIITDFKTADQRITSPGRIARALAVFCVDEIVVYDDSPQDSRPRAVDHDRYTGDTDPCHFITHVLSYLETPPFMRKALFPLHDNLAKAGLLPSLDMPHHPHKDEWLPFREGFTVKGKPDSGKGTLVEVGMRRPVTITNDIPPNTRVTLQFPEQSFNNPEPVHPQTPRTEAGYYWGYSVRSASSLSAVFTESQFEGGYDVSIGTSERGTPASRAFPSFKKPSFNHLLIVFGGPRGLEYAAMNDGELGGMGISGGRTKELFDHWINVLPNQGSRTIRTDEAVFIALTSLRGLWDNS
ncbi:DUF171-domain-containing protein [Cryphonectria parasitica EP155]|uniref:DUF171-domain-containing protein n=1 Tax=Cryphonectria parasitica (strain ATCC 38755 / EP155) TaxID=660469 RepID=A0A9P4Y8E1_CRYP1|nr:DUF171-domain-containing protein [Cryphonectria parasitica EP155]KAF3768847.1 DUF171-domain-containing protein [Cryphonectria parasitica EP155]